MTVEINHSLSVDCAIFGYDGEDLKVLLVEQRHTPITVGEQRRLKLPGSIILANETIPDAARRVLRDRTGLERVFLKQTDIFSDPSRIYGNELEWISKLHNISTTRVITVGHYALVRITPTILRNTKLKGAKWYSYDEIPRLAMDHTLILKHALGVLRADFELSPIVSELLPKKFTIRELQNLYSAVMGIGIDSRNFRKKVLGADIVKHTGEHERGVAHKPAEYFVFNQTAFRRSLKRGLRYL
ncbi:MAG: NUDIX domain-containing protein [Rikenellaceae bacterium]